MRHGEHMFALVRKTVIIKNARPIDGSLLAFAQHRLRLFRNVEFTRNHLIASHSVPKHHHKNVERHAEHVRYTLVQADEYLTSAKNASLATKPVLLYYATMSFALAMILTKGGGNSRLDVLRQHHGSHGLTLSVGSLSRSAPLEELLRSMRAKPQERIEGERYGTFELWRESHRELPIPVPAHLLSPDQAQTTRVIPFFNAEDNAPRATPKDGFSLFDAVTSIPDLRTVIAHLNIAPALAGAMFSINATLEGINGEVNMIIHPSPPSTLQALYARMKFAPSMVNTINVRELPSGLIAAVPVRDGKIDGHIYIPPTTTMSQSEYFISTNDWDWGEFGAFYVALHIVGNIARYYPDAWMPHVENSTALALITEELCEAAQHRLAALAATELDRCLYYKAGRGE